MMQGDQGSRADAIVLKYCTPANVAIANSGDHRSWWFMLAIKVFELVQRLLRQACNVPRQASVVT